jgi:antirestriction protein
MNITNSRIYVCNKESYAQGKYLDLICFPSESHFRAECQQLFLKETTFLYFDCENIPQVYISEKWISPNYFPLIRAVADLKPYMQEAFSAWLDYYKPYLEEKDITDIINCFNYSYEGNYKNKNQFVYQYANNQMNITKKNNPLFDFNSFEELLFCNLFHFINGKYVFKRIQKN